VGVVVCNPFGYEALCAHRSLRHLAEEAAQRGFPALRFDYDGTGDSAGDDLDGDRWAAWLASVRGAVRELRARTGVRRVVLVGVRLGASIAAAAAADAVDDADIAGVAMIAPIASGRPWLRELRALQATMGRAAAPPEFALPEGVQESVGLLITPETRAALESIELASLGARLPDALLLIDRDDRPSQARLAEQWGTSGRTVRHAVLPGFVEMMSDPHESVVPVAMVTEVMSWLESGFPAFAEGVAVPGEALVSVATVAIGIEERLHLFDKEQRLFGVVTAPLGARPERAVVLLNSGANHHIGNGRMYVKFARRLAAAGWLVLRYDVSGIGDSLPHQGAPENEVYTPHAVDDLATALAFLQREYAPGRIEAMGLCSGAYHAFKGAVAGEPIDGVTVVNPLVFFWKPGMSLAYPPFQMVQAAAQYQRSMLMADKWLKLVRGQVDLRAIVKVVAHRVEDRTRSAAREIARAMHLRVHEDLAAELSSVVERGAALRFVFSVGDPGEALLRVGAGRRLGRLDDRGAVSLTYLADCDHSLSAAWMHEALWAQFSRAIGVP
jgi:alpha-beta hydrolase superfamily lysophospholipase